MECVLFPRLPYTELPTVVRSQREALDAKIRGFSNSHIVHPGLQHFADGQRQRLHIASIPGGYQAGGLDCWPATQNHTESVCWHWAGAEWPLVCPSRGAGLATRWSAE